MGIFIGSASGVSRRAGVFILRDINVLVSMLEVANKKHYTYVYIHTYIYMDMDVHTHQHSSIELNLSLYTWNYLEFSLDGIQSTIPSMCM